MIKILDKGYIRLVECMGDDLTPVRSARCSTDTDDITGNDLEKDIKLIQYLLDENHTSPFESIVLTFEVKAPIFVFRQWHRHRTWSYNELSARYSPLPNEFYVPKPFNIGKQGTLQKQTREIDPDTLTLLDLEFLEEQIERYSLKADDCNNEYRGLLDMGWPRELARTILPVCWYSRMYATVNLHNLFKFLVLRNHEHAQFEIREYAKAIELIVEDKFPLIYFCWKRSLQSSYFKQVRKFHEKFGLKYEGPPRQLPDDVADFRIKFLQEELDEYKEACSSNDLVKQLDALADIIVVALGTAHLQGFPIDSAFKEVMKANMRKVNSTKDHGEQVKTKIVKPEGWQGPEEGISKLINKLKDDYLKNKDTTN